MKNFLTGLFALLLFCSAAPPSAFAANNIKMVTYFPVPYASYNDLGVTGTCDIGLLDNCALDSGPSLKVFKRTGDTGPLNTGTLTVKGGSLDLQSSALNSKISGISLTAGQNGTIGTGTLEFKHDLQVNTMPSLIQSAEATNKAVLEKLTLFNESFPGCDAKDNEISWKRLTINDKSGVFLVCGDAKPAETTDCSKNPDSDSCCRDIQFFLGNMALCCNNMTDSLFTYLYNEGYPNCCTYPSVIQNHRAACCEDGTAPNDDIDGYCYDVRYHWEAVTGKTLRYTYCDNSTEACWTRSPLNNYPRCASTRCNADTVGQYCLEDNGEPDACGLSRILSDTLRADGTRCYEVEGEPLMTCFEDKTPLF